jgi:hypothetical protein
VTPALRTYPTPGVALYNTECGDCHMAFPPTMLPAASWQDMMRALDDHFGDDAELDAETTDQIAAFLVQYSAGTGSGEILADEEDD